MLFRVPSPGFNTLARLQMTTRLHAGPGRVTSLHVVAVALVLANCCTADALMHRRKESDVEPAAQHFQPAEALPSQIKNRPSLIDYNPVANASAVVVSSDGKARFTVLSERVVRLEYASVPGVFEDHSTIAIMNRNTPVPPFTSSIAGGILRIDTAAVRVSYTLGTAFSSSTLSVASLVPSSAFKSWSFGQPDTGNLLGTIRGLDEQSNTELNCTVNAFVKDNGENNRKLACRTIMRRSLQPCVVCRLCMGHGFA